MFLEPILIKSGLFPCPGCRNPEVSRLNAFCRECLDKLPFIDRSSGCCPGCGGVMDGALAVCSRCLAEPQRLWTSAAAVLEYRGYAKELIRRFKFLQFPELSRPFGYLLAETLQKSFDHPFDLIVPMPTAPRRFIRRGYNQTALLAAVAARQTGIPTTDVLYQFRSRSKQSERDRKQRHRGLSGIFKVRNGNILQNKRLLLIDDVLTTGSTLHAAAAELLKHSPASVDILVLARTPGLFHISK